MGATRQGQEGVPGFFSLSRDGATGFAPPHEEGSSEEHIGMIHGSHQGRVARMLLRFFAEKEQTELKEHH